MLELQDTTVGGERLRVVENDTVLALQNDQLLSARRIDYLSALEAESIQILREVAASFQRPALLFSGGKDSICLLRLAEKAFRPGKFPFPLVHVDTGHNFPEVIELRNRIVDRLCERLIVASVPEALSNGIIRETPGVVSRNRLQSPTLVAAIEKYNFDAAIGGARRDEEKARAKERIFSFRDAFGQWQPRSQRPELWNIYNTRVLPGEHMRVFPISNWTEFDVWDYIARERLELPSIYFAHHREVVERDGQLLPVSEFLPLLPNEKTRIAQVRMRTVGDMSCTGCHQSEAETVPQIISELSTMQIAERGSRTDDKQSDTAMEDRKKEGYF